MSQYTIKSRFEKLLTLKQSIINAVKAKNATIADNSTFPQIVDAINWIELGLPETSVNEILDALNDEIIPGNYLDKATAISLSKDAIRNAILSKSGILPQSSPFSLYAEAILQIPGIKPETLNEILDNINREVVAGDYISKSNAVKSSINQIRAAIIAKGVAISEDFALKNYAQSIASIQTQAQKTYSVKWWDPYTKQLIKEEDVVSGNDAIPPAAPLHPNLTFDGWSGSFTHINSDVDVVARYCTTDSKTYIGIFTTTISALAFTMALNKNSSDLMTINWGDGSTSTSSVYGGLSISHTYSSPGEYIISIECAGTYSLGNNSSLFTAGYNTTTLRYVLLSSKVVRLYGSVFSGAYNLTRFLTSSALVTLDTSAFANTAIEVLALPEISQIPASIFNQCTRLKIIGMPATITSILNSSFNLCAMLQRIDLRCITSIGASSFNQCYAISSVKLNSIISVGASAFAYTGLKEASFGGGLTTVGNSAFSYTFLTEIELPAGVTTGDGFSSITSLKKISAPGMASPIFSACNNLKEISISGSYTSIPNNAFNGCRNLESLVLPGSLTTIGTYAFAYCSSIRSMSFPASLTAIGDGAFNYAQLLEILIFSSATPPTMTSSGFPSTSNRTLRIYVPDAQLSTYKAAAGFSSVSGYIYPVSQLVAP